MIIIIIIIIIIIRSASNLAPSAFLASADGASGLKHQLLPVNLSSISYSEWYSALSTWKSGLPAETPLPTSRNHQKSWDKPKVDHFMKPFCPGVKTKWRNPDC